MVRSCTKIGNGDLSLFELGILYESVVIVEW